MESDPEAAVDLVRDSGRTALLFMLAAFVLTFAITRAIVWLIRSGRGPFGNVKMGGLHIHHLVPGIFLTLIAATLEFALVPHGVVRAIFAAAFGAGAALVLDEFALWLHLDDVYWETEGRKSVDVVVGAAGAGLIALVASNPFAPNEDQSVEVFAGFLAVSLSFAIIALLKGRMFFGIAGVFLPYLALIPAFRLARPGSPWFHWFYKDGTARQAKAELRVERRHRFGIEGLKDTIAGTNRRGAGGR